MDKEQEASKIVQEALVQAEKIKNEAKEKAEEVYKKTYEQTVAKAKRKSIELKKRAKEDAEHETAIFLPHAREQIKKTRRKAEKKFGEAVNAVLNEILS